MTVLVVTRPEMPVFWMHKDDLALWGKPRDIVFDPNYPAGSAPAVFPLDLTSVWLTRAWQEFMCPINYAMERKHVASIFGTTRAFANGTGFPGHANWITMEELDKELPKFDKIRCCARFCMKGTVDGDYLIAETLDGLANPPDPTRINPWLTPWYFYVANNVTTKGSLFPFPNGGYYPWTPDPSRMYTFIPFVRGQNPIRIPLSNLIPTNKIEVPYQDIA